MLDVFRPGAHDALAASCGIPVVGSTYGRQPLHSTWPKQLLKALVPKLCPHIAAEVTWSKVRW